MKQPSLNQLISNPSSMEDYDPNAMSVTQARSFIQQFLSPVTETIEKPIVESLDCVVANNIVSPYNVPNHDNSAMDGYAFKFSEGVQILKIIGTAFAGKPFLGKVKAGEGVKIMTGAVIPAGADTVVMQEKTVKKSDCITLLEAPKPGANVRLAGEDLKLGQIVLKQGHRIQTADIGLLASLGLVQVKVYRQLKVAFFSTGDELVSVGKPLESGQIYDSNRYTLFGMLKRLNVKIADFGAVPDDVAQLETALLKAAQENDVVITSGGVSVGEADHMKALLSKHGQVLFWKINMKPGRPLAYGKLRASASHSTHYFGLPGNPVATMVTFYQFVRDALLLIMGSMPEPAPLFKLICTEPIKKLSGRTEFQRGIMFLDNNEWKVKPVGNQSSGVLSSMSVANCFIVLEENAGNCAAGCLVSVQPFKGII